MNRIKKITLWYKFHRLSHKRLIEIDSFSTAKVLIDSKISELAARTETLGEYYNDELKMLEHSNDHLEFAIANSEDSIQKQASIDALDPVENEEPR